MDFPGNSRTNQLIIDIFDFIIFEMFVSSSFIGVLSNTETLKICVISYKERSLGNNHILNDFNR